MLGVEGLCTMNFLTIHNVFLEESESTNTLKVDLNEHKVFLWKFF